MLLKMLVSWLQKPTIDIIDMHAAAHMCLYVGMKFSHPKRCNEGMMYQ